jgi:hypothetical protein
MEPDEVNPKPKAIDRSLLWLRMFPVCDDPSRSRPQRPLLMLFLGVLMLVGSIFFLPRAIRLSKGVHAQGVVVEIREHHRKGVSYTPVFRFQDNQRREFTVVSCENNSLSYQVGEQVPVFYNPGDPSDAEIATFAQLWRPPALFFVFGLAASAMGGIVLYRRAQVSRSVV